MVKSKTEIWHYYEESLNENKKTSCVKCKFCKNKYAKNATRMRSHLLHCIHVPDAVKSKFRQYNVESTPRVLLHSQLRNEIDTSTVKNDSAISDRGGLFKTPKFYTTTTKSHSSSIMAFFFDGMKEDEHTELKVLFARAIYASCTPFSIVENNEWQTFFKKLRPSFVLPTTYLLANRLLNDEYDRVQVQVEEKLRQSENLSLQCDGWSNLRNESVINFIITTPDPLFVKTVLTKTERHTGDYLESIITDVLEAYGPEKFMAIVTDNASNMKKGTKQCTAKYPHLISYGCLAHTLHLLCHDVLKLESVRRQLSIIKNIVMTIRASHLLCAKFTEIKKEVKVMISLSLPAKTRWGSHVKCLKDFIKCKFVLQRLSICEDPLIQEKLRSVKLSILDEEFWSNTDTLTNILKPITQAIINLEGDRPTIYSVCQTFKGIEKSFSSNLEFTNLTEIEKEQVKQFFQERKEYAIQPIHLAADLLNPRLMGSNLLPNQRISAMKFISDLAKKMNLTSTGSAMTAMTDLGNYLAKAGFFSESFLWDVLDETNVVTWWKGFCGHTFLAKIAVRILTMPCTSAATERSFSSQSNIHTNKRNKLTAERAAKLNYVQHNIKLLRLSRNAAVPLKNKELHEAATETEQSVEENLTVPFSSVDDEIPSPDHKKLTQKKQTYKTCKSKDKIFQKTPIQKM
ncbi:hypothetical protein NQ314_001718 [Rhamnusium bicolor]|uniref:BED-type domain-containing protein n=1 Tax=Rhamnusium bicolor TaxID=1586634 RepID=A0AAV8ZS62_9CUCU|nr:hypothetical protein NQ314_001718 [Rhamnusium bicolor]